MITEIIASSGKLGIYVGKNQDTINPSSDIDVSKVVGVCDIDPASPLKNFGCVNDSICDVNGFDT